MYVKSVLRKYRHDLMEFVGSFMNGSTVIDVSISPRILGEWISG